MSAASNTAPLPEGVGAGVEAGLEDVGRNIGWRPAALLSASATAHLSERERAAQEVGPKGGSGDNGRRVCDVVGRECHGASPGEDEGRW